MRVRAKIATMIAFTTIVACVVNADEKPIAIKDCMKCQQSVVPELRTLAKTKNVNWDDAAKKSKSWLNAAGDLAKNKPPLGDAKSWKEQTDRYVAHVKAVDDAVDKKDATGLNRSLSMFGSSCAGCHSKHKPK